MRYGFLTTVKVKEVNELCSNEVCFDHRICVLIVFLWRFDERVIVSEGLVKLCLHDFKGVLSFITFVLGRSFFFVSSFF